MAKPGVIRQGSGELSTIIGPDAHFEGKLQLKASARIDGTLVGDLSSQETVTIGPDGKVDGNISAREIIVGGKVTGMLQATAMVVLEEKSELNGDLKSMRLVVQEGARFNGTCQMGEGSALSVKGQVRKINLD